MRVLSRFLIVIVVSLVAGFAPIPTWSQNWTTGPCRAQTSTVTGEAHVAHQAERASNLLDKLVQAYEGNNRNEALAKDITSYAAHEEPVFSKDDANKMEELAQRPEVKATIEAIYRERRSAEIEQAHNFNVAPCFLYPNPMLQDYVNKLGQSLVPRESTGYYAFRIVYDPRPDAWSFSTGSVYVTTGLVAMLDNQAQLAFVLAHEIGHVEHRHLYQQTRGEVLQQLLETEKIKSVRHRGMILGAIAAGVGAAAGGSKAGGFGALAGAELGYGGAQMVTNLVLALHRPRFTDWSAAEERDADEFALKDVLAHRFDVREAPKVFVALATTIHRDDRVGMGFHYGRLENLDGRRQHVQALLTGAMKADIEAQSKQPLVAATPNFALLMAEVKRDNGIVALDYDLFDEARQNLEDAVAARSNDPTAQLYLGEVYKLTARDASEEQKAIDHFTEAVRLDTGRNSFPQPHLEHALALLKRGDPQNYPDAQKEIKTYIEMYKQEHAGQVPQGFPVTMGILYDYLSLTGDVIWADRPVVNVWEENVSATAQQLPAAAPATSEPARGKVRAGRPGGGSH
jgi:predicted Zn-dependent protease